VTKNRKGEIEMFFKIIVTENMHLNSGNPSVFIAHAIEVSSSDRPKQFVSGWSFTKMEAVNFLQDLIVSLCGSATFQVVDSGPHQQYSPDQIKSSIKHFLEFGQRAQLEQGGGLFSPGGWDYECLKWHMENLDK